MPERPFTVPSFRARARDVTFTDVDVIRIWRNHLDPAEQRRVVEFFCRLCDTLRSEQATDKVIEVGLIDLVEIAVPFIVGLIPVVGQILETVEFVTEIIDLFEEVSLPPFPDCPRPGLPVSLPRVPVLPERAPFERVPLRPPLPTLALPEPIEGLIPLDLPPARVPEPVPIRPPIVSRETPQPRTKLGRFSFVPGPGLSVSIGTGGLPSGESTPGTPGGVGVGIGIGFSHTRRHIIELVQETRKEIVKERRPRGKKSKKSRSTPRRSEA